jgi:hypothetical protein
LRPKAWPQEKIANFEEEDETRVSKKKKKKKKIYGKY